MSQDEGWRRGEGEESRNKNILLAVLSLMKELDGTSLELVVKEGEKLLGAHRYHHR